MSKSWFSGKLGNRRLRWTANNFILTMTTWLTSWRDARRMGPSKKHWKRGGSGIRRPTRRCECTGTPEWGFTGQRTRRLKIWSDADSRWWWQRRWAPQRLPRSDWMQWCLGNAPLLQRAQLNAQDRGWLRHRVRELKWIRWWLWLGWTQILRYFLLFFIYLN